MPPTLSRALPALWERAEAAYAEARFREAARLYAQLATLLTPKTPEWYTCQLHRAHCLRLLGRFRHALQLYEQLQRFVTETSREDSTDLIVGKALSLRVLGDLKTAQQLLQQALQTYQRQHDTEGILHTLWALGTTLRFAGDFRSAWGYLRQAMELYRRTRVGSPTYLYCALGGLSRMQGAPKRSLRYYWQAHRNALREEDLFGIAYSACGIANAYRILGDWEAAEHFFTVARLHYEHIGERLSYAYTLWGEAMLFLLLRRWDAAAERLHSAERIFQRIGDRRGLIYTTMVHLQLTALSHGHLPKDHLHSLQRALRWANRHGYWFELLHLHLLRRLLGIEPQESSEAELQRAYRACGSQWLRWSRPIALPVNFP
ncbi:MAG: tetratricopeptide repeat protein [Candidatus Kapabacteria bacterium]|nr:tetratricopeptide repeat protein [Candidatus Kapabacteria bacterium]MDW8011700.1 tetratricopeptide repeat protein [Bacteroidota bacterium]